jgi:uncharacterized protein YyaL (SSP411 family)
MDNRMSSLDFIPSNEQIAALPEDGGEQFNRLIFEQSPYLLQHAGNPVDWYPWGEAAFAKAKNEGKPIFLSIGYATCHWCHVMARESFEDQEVAALLNRDFVSIKVDREERPDIDQLYMRACQAMSGRGGWPLSCFLTPERDVFFTATYFPKHARHGQPGMMQVLPGIAYAWQQQQEKVLKGADELKQSLLNSSGEATKAGLADLSPDIEHEAFAQFQQSYDAQNGGFGSAPKFPSPHQHLFLLRYWRKYQEPKALQMVRHALTAMRFGGLFDHIGFGFHRYSTDAHWLLPHVEKMLYDQAMLLLAYSEAYAATGEGLFKQTAEEIHHYVTSRMQHAQGGFFSAEDADSEGEEGKFYVWGQQQLEQVLSGDDLDWFVQHFQISKAGNFRDEATGEPSRNNIPHLTRHSGGSLSSDPGAWNKTWQPLRKRLFANREKRVHPLLDDKILSDWNGLMIAALARGSLLVDNPAFLKSAEKAFAFVQQNLLQADGKLLKRFRNGQAGLPAHLDDYAYLIQAGLTLHQATLEPTYLEQALAWMEIAITQFWDTENGGFFFTAAETELTIRTKEIYDGAQPSGNSVMASNLAHLFQLTGNSRWQSMFEQLTQAFATQVNHYPAGFCQLLCAKDLNSADCHNLVFADNRTDPGLLSALRARFLPHLVWLSLTEENKTRLAEIAPFVADIDCSELSLHHCRQFSCELPVRGLEKIQAKLQALS